MNLNSALKILAKHLLYKTAAARVIGHRYTYNFSPVQLSFLCDCISGTADVNGSIVEVGCFLGHTTVFLNKHMDCCHIEKPYYAIDTFNGFVSRDVEYEVRARSKNKSDLWKAFKGNSRRFFDTNMALNSIRRVRSIETDAATLDFSTLGSISFCLVDLDLYRPVKEVLRRIYPQLTSNGIIVVDDCKDNCKFDGALDAYREFVAEHALRGRIEHQKLGVIQKTL